MTEVPHISDEGLEIIRVCEGLRLTAYKCPAGVYSIGYGHTGPDVYKGLTITREQAEEWLRKDVYAAELAVYELVTVPLTINQFSALVSFVYNIGRGAFSTSTMRKILNQGYIGSSAAEQFDRWIYADKKILPGLVERRKREKALFLKA